MRIIGGKFGGRVLKTPRGGATRPTSGRVRETLFNIIAPDLPGSSHLMRPTDVSGMATLLAAQVERHRRHGINAGPPLTVAEVTPGGIQRTTLSSLPTRRRHVATLSPFGDGLRAGCIRGY